jgi:hypothetical protein
MTDHELLERAGVEIAPLSPLAATLVRRFAEDLAATDVEATGDAAAIEEFWRGREAALFEQPRPVSLNTDPRPVA